MTSVRRATFNLGVARGLDTLVDTVGVPAKRAQPSADDHGHGRRKYQHRQGKRQEFPDKRPEAPHGTEDSSE